MNTILQKRIEEAAKKYCQDKNYILPDDTELSLEALTAIDAYIEAAKEFYNNCNLAKSSWWDDGELNEMSESKETFIAGAEWQKQRDQETINPAEDPISEDLENAASEYVREDFHERSRADFKAGAEWYKRQMKETLQTEYEKGRFDMREEIMKDAVDATVLDVDAQTIEFGLWPEKLLDIKEGDKVKIVIVKED